MIMSAAFTYSIYRMKKKLCKYRIYVYQFLYTKLFILI